jgi:hypothetical protein
MASLKNIFSLGGASDSSATPAPIVSTKRTYQQWGHTQAGKVDASPNALQPCLQATFIEIRQKIASDEVEQSKRRIPIQQKIADLEAKNTNTDNQIKAAKEGLDFRESEIKRLNNEISDIKEYPQKITGDSFAKASFWIGAIIITLLTVYLFIFYSSAAYSAFFKNFTADDTNIVNSIFDAQAIAKAIADGFTELGLILTIPAVFLGLGFLIHKFSEQKGVVKYFKITGLVATTFIFDFIIAYEIVEKIYNIKKEGSFEVMDDMTIKMATYQVNFWLIIFAGFVVYVIWGFVFDFVMIEYRKLDQVGTAIKNKEQRIHEYENECKDLKNEIQQFETQKNGNMGEIEKLKIELEGVVVFVQDVKQDIDNFFTGWLSFMKNAGKTQMQIDECTLIRDNFIYSIQSTSIKEQ